MSELLAAVHTPDELRCAVLAGADAVCLHGGNGAFSFDAIREAVRFCRVRGVPVRYAPETANDDALADAVADAVSCGVDALLVDSPAAVRLCRAVAPKIALHASAAFGVRSLSGLRFCEALGVTRVVLPRGIDLASFTALSHQSAISLEIALYADGCADADGTCLLAASSPAGACPRPCARPCGFGKRGNEHLLEAPPVRKIAEAHDWAVRGAAAVTVEAGAYTADAVALARTVLADGGCTTQTAEKIDAVFSAPPKAARPEETPRVAVRFALLALSDQPTRLAAMDDDGNKAIVDGDAPIPAEFEASKPHWQKILSQTDGTPYRMQSLQASVAEGYDVPDAVLRSLRRAALSQLTALRGRIADVQPSPPPERVCSDAPKTAPVWTASVQSKLQITPELLALKPEVLYVPLREFGKNASWVDDVPRETTLCAVCPRLLPDADYDAVEQTLKALYERGVRQALCSDYGQFGLLKRLGFAIRWDAPRGVKTDGDAFFWADAGCISAACSPTVSLAQIQKLQKPLPLEAVVYGRLPLLLTNDCLIRARSGVCACDGATVKLVDRDGSELPLIAENGACRNLILSGRKLYLLDRQPELAKLGLWATRLQFTTEHAGEVDIAIRKLRRGAPFDAVVCTRGFYPRGAAATV